MSTSKKNKRARPQTNASAMAQCSVLCFNKDMKKQEMWFLAPTNASDKRLVAVFERGPDQIQWTVTTDVNAVKGCEDHVILRILKANRCDDAVFGSNGLLSMLEQNTNLRWTASTRRRQSRRPNSRAHLAHFKCWREHMTNKRSTSWQVLKFSPFSSRSVICEREILKFQISNLSASRHRSSEATGLSFLNLNRLFIARTRCTQECVNDELLLLDQNTMLIVHFGVTSTSVEVVSCELHLLLLHSS